MKSTLPAVFITLESRLHGVFIARDSKLPGDEYLNEYSKKFEIVSGLAYLNQEKLFDEKKNGDEKSGDTVPFRTR